MARMSFQLSGMGESPLAQATHASPASVLVRPGPWLPHTHTCGQGRIRINKRSSTHLLS